jgi:uncharacterized protein YukE
MVEPEALRSIALRLADCAAQLEAPFARARSGMSSAWVGPAAARLLEAAAVWDQSCRVVADSLRELARKLIEEAATLEADAGRLV